VFVRDGNSRHEKQMTNPDELRDEQL